MSVGYLCASPILHPTTKHVAVSYHFVREKVADKSLVVRYVSTKEQRADLLTKQLSNNVFSYLRDKLIKILLLSLRGGGIRVTNDKP